MLRLEDIIYDENNLKLSFSIVNENAKTNFMFSNYNLQKIKATENFKFNLIEERSEDEQSFFEYNHVNKKLNIKLYLDDLYHTSIINFEYNVTHEFIDKFVEMINKYIKFVKRYNC